MTHTIAIVGRPNVGKSTLFNRLAGRRIALVDPTPGLTRDRKEAEADIFGETMRLIDTAGLEDAVEAGTMSGQMRAQTLKGIQDADLVLFLIDARAGVTPLDRAFAELVRGTGKPVLAVANKCEGKAAESGYYEAFSLGLGEPVAISAEHSEGMSDLQSEILARLKPEREIGEDEAKEGEDETLAPDVAKPIRIAVVGRPNAGKSTLINALIGDDRLITSPEPGTTRDSIAVDLEYSERKLKLFDTAGLRRKSRITEAAEKLSVGDALNAIRFAEVVILLMDATHPFEQQDLQIGELVVNEGRALVIGVNKWDLIEDRQKTLKDIRAVAEHTFADVKGIGIVPVSAKSGQGTDKLLAATMAVYEAWNRRLSTAGLNRWLAEALQRHPPPALSGKRIKLRYMTQASSRPPTFVAFCSRPEGLPKSYIRYLSNGIREAFDLKGTPIRFQLRKGENPYARGGRKG